MNFRLLVLNIKQFCPQLSVPVIKQRVNVRYQQILAAEDWEFLTDSTTVRLIEATSNTTAESCAVTQGSATVTGTATSWSGISGYLFRVGTDPQPYVISSVDSTTQLTLETNYGNDDASGEDFEYWPQFYSPAVGEVSEIRSVVYQSPLGEVSRDWLNARDPERESTGSPTVYSVFVASEQGGTVSFEVWPVPDEEYVVTVYYKKSVSDLSADSDEPLCRPEVLEAGVLWDCYRLVYGVTQNPAFIGLARDAQTNYQQLYREMLIEDLSTASLPRRVRSAADVGGAGLFMSNEYFVDHDTEGW